MRSLVWMCLVAGTLGLFAGDSYARATSPPDSVLSINLDSLLAQVERNPTLRAMRLEAAALATRPEQVGALPDPDVMAGYRPFAIRSVSGIAPAEVMARQMLPYPGKRKLAAETAALGAEAAERNADAAALDLALDVQHTYYELYRIQQQDRLAEEFARRLRDFEEVAAVRYEVGQGPQQSILKAQVERLALERRRLEYDAARRAQLERLARLTNRPDLASPQYEVVLTAPTITLPADTGSTERALDRLPEAEALRLIREQAEKEIDRARLEYRPDFMIGAGLMDMMPMDGTTRPLSDLDKRFTIQFGVTIPLQKDKRRAAVREAELRREQVDARLEALETEIKTKTQDLLASLEADEQALTLYRDALIPQAETTVASTLSAYSAGTIGFLDLLDAERMLYDLRMSYEETLARYAQTRAALRRTLGISLSLIAGNRSEP